MSTHSSADKLRDLHAESLRYNIPCCTAALALPEIAAVIEAAEKIDPAEGRHWNRSDSQALTNALAALSARLGDVTSQKDGAS